MGPRGIDITDFCVFSLTQTIIWGFLGGSVVKNLPAMQEPQETQVRFLGWEDFLEEEMATHYSIIVWRIS